MEPPQSHGSGDQHPLCDISDLYYQKKRQVENSKLLSEQLETDLVAAKTMLRGDHRVNHLFHQLTLPTIPSDPSGGVPKRGLLRRPSLEAAQLLEQHYPSTNGVPVGSTNHMPMGSTNHMPMGSTTHVHVPPTTNTHANTSNTHATTSNTHANTSNTHANTTNLPPSSHQTPTGPPLNPATHPDNLHGTNIIPTHHAQPTPSDDPALEGKLERIESLLQRLDQSRELHERAAVDVQPLNSPFTVASAQTSDSSFANAHASVDKTFQRLSEEIAWVDEQGIRGRVDSEKRLTKHMDALDRRLDVLEDQFAKSHVDKLFERMNHLEAKLKHKADQAQTMKNLATRVNDTLEHMHHMLEDDVAAASPTGPSFHENVRRELEAEVSRAKEALRSDLFNKQREILSNIEINRQMETCNAEEKIAVLSEKMSVLEDSVQQEHQSSIQALELLLEQSVHAEKRQNHMSVNSMQPTHRGAAPQPHQGRRGTHSGQSSLSRKGSHSMGGQSLSSRGGSQNDPGYLATSRRRHSRSSTVGGGPVATGESVAPFRRSTWLGHR